MCRRPSSTQPHLPCGCPNSHRHTVRIVSDILEKVLDMLRHWAMLDETTGIVVAVSGGADSVALLDLLLRIRASASPVLATPIKLHIAHLDHQLRGRESEEDSAFVRALAERVNVAATFGAINVREIATKQRRGTEAVARKIRYQFLLSVAAESGCNRIATGHTMSDQAETFLLRLVRGAGARGLAAMRPVAPVPFAAKQMPSRKAAKRQRSEDIETPNPQDRPFLSSASARLCLSAFSAAPLVIRPLLTLTREQIEAYCHERNLPFRTDASNLDLRYARNRVRQSLLPAMREFNPRLVETLARTASLLGEDEAALEEIVSGYLKDAYLASSADNRHTSTYALGAFRAPEAALRRRMIRQAIERLRAATSPGNEEADRGAEIELRHILSVEGLIESGASGKRIALPNGIEVWREFQTLAFTWRATPPPAETYAIKISSEQMAIDAGGLQISILRNQSGILWPQFLHEAQRGRASGRDWMMAMLDDEKLPPTVCIRPRRAGEGSRLLGHHTVKKIKAMMIARKISASRRTSWPILATPDGLYIWSPGLPPAAAFAADASTKQLAVCQAAEI